jgi:hypothetical protein
MAMLGLRPYKSPSRVTGWLRVLVGLAAGFTLWPWALASVKTTQSTDTAPAAWVAYAAGVSKVLGAWLSADDPMALRLRSDLDGMRATPGESPPAVRLALWIGPDGTLTDIQISPFDHAQAPADLRALLIGRHLPSGPPLDMLQPLRIQLQLEPAPAAQSPEKKNPGFP